MASLRLTEGFLKKSTLHNKDVKLNSSDVWRLTEAGLIVMMCELVVGWLHAVDKLIAQRRGGGGSGLNCSLG